MGIRHLVLVAAAVTAGCCCPPRPCAPTPDRARVREFDPSTLRQPIEEPALTVMIHPVHDLVEAMPTVELVGPDERRTESPQEMLLAYVRGLGVPIDTLAFQGDFSMVVKAPPASHERIAEALDGLRAEVAKTP